MAKICKDLVGEAQGRWQPGMQQDGEEQQADTANRTPLGSARVLIRSGSVTSAVQRRILGMDGDDLDPS
jgi:hypothetical protein